MDVEIEKIADLTEILNKQDEIWMSDIVYIDFVFVIECEMLKFIFIDFKNT